MAAKEGRAWDSDKTREKGAWSAAERAPPSEFLPSGGSRWDRSDLYEDTGLTPEQERVNVKGYRPTADNDAVWDTVP